MCTSTRSLSVAALVAIPFFVLGCETSSRNGFGKTDTAAVVYDSARAAALGADEYGMRRYVVAFLKAGPNRTQDSTLAAQIQEGHMQNIRRLAEENKLLLAGPFLDDGPLRGIFVFNVETLDEARALTESDPAIQAGRLVMELHPWYGTAALLDVGDIHRQLVRSR